MDPDVGELLTRLVDGQMRALGESLVGTYLFGSVATGDFEPGVSDVDTVTVLRSDLGTAQLESLEQLHLAIVEGTPRWEDRVEVVYLSTRALVTFRSDVSTGARIAPGEPFHAIELDHTWLIDWCQLRDVGIPLFGPAVASVVPAISLDEYIEAVRQHMIAWQSWAGELATQGSQAYAILTMSRGLRTSRTGEHVSKREAARWACEVVPEHSALIRDAVVWREQARIGPPADGAATRDRTQRFAMDLAALVG
jgi:hypothetical protein